MIYLDHAATTPLRPEARDVLQEFLAGHGPFANASSSHGPGREMARRVALAREEFADLIGAAASDILWTSGATEANNLAILGRARFARELGRTLVVPRTEHKAVIDPVRYLTAQGWRAHWLDPVAGTKGTCTADQFLEALGGDTVLACAMAVNNETGQIQDVAGIAQACCEKDVPLHVDAAQALGKIPLQGWPGVGTMSFSGHKLGAPIGVGALYVRSRPRVALEPLQLGGGQERGMRSGTLAAPQILAFVAAAKAAVDSRESEQRRLSALREELWFRFTQRLSGVIRNGDRDQSSAHVLNVSFPAVHGESLRALLDADIAISSGSACSSAQAESSYVLRALGHSDDQANASLRFSFGHTTTADDIAAAAEKVIVAVESLRSREPLGAKS